MRSSPKYDKIRTRDILTTVQVKRDLGRWCVKLVRKVYLTTLQNENGYFNISLTDTLKFRYWNWFSTSSPKFEGEPETT